MYASRSAYEPKKIVIITMGQLIKKISTFSYFDVSLSTITSSEGRVFLHPPPLPPPLCFAATLCVL